MVGDLEVLEPGMMRSALGPFAGNRSWPAHRASSASPSAPAHLRQPGPDPIRRRVDRDGMGGHGHRVIGEVIAGQAAVALLFRGAVVMAGPLQRQIASNSTHAERASRLSPHGATSTSIKTSVTLLGSTSATRAVRQAAGGCGTIAAPPRADLPLPWDTSASALCRLRARSGPVASGVSAAHDAYAGRTGPGRGYVSPACKGSLPLYAIKGERCGSRRGGSSAREHVRAGRPPGVHGLVRADRVECPPDRVR